MADPTYTQTFTPPVDELACAEATLTVLHDAVRPLARDDMSRSTPCSEFDVAALTDHLMSSITTLGGAAGAEFPQDSPDDAVDRRLVMAARPALDAWHRRGLEGTVDLGPGAFPARSAVNILALEFLVHGWDYARAAGRDLEVPDTLAGYVLDAARDIITPEGRSAVGFDQPVQVGDDASDFAKLLAFTGRKP
ncbi:TIGR03086 family metal-binding protein [Mycolicibacterium tokaiense]|jgi:uncharacterized protein (TIGR03086 family)|uniref:TIGR03086 family metal-binding protein n=1 Tax=Mycolicibacterium tokaiense TaxID=39695 RepID=UPI000811B8ED|nr:TIGR03086 family metal-binding protein [Mycolicibacterium tokaiense]ANW62365.1 TIGR03086 family protein [Mycobacterium sp. djl-10]BBY86082.1 TIGR03086 family protein [Mycolicibacterium tokaiense]